MIRGRSSFPTFVRTCASARLLETPLTGPRAQASRFGSRASRNPINSPFSVTGLRLLRVKSSVENRPPQLVLPTIVQAAIRRNSGIISPMALPVLRGPDFAHATRYQIWTDALCFRQMAKQAPNKYLESMCVRNAVLSAWTALEMACCDALGVKRFKGRDFKRDLNKELQARGKPTIDFGSGVWGRLSCKLMKGRNEYAHSGVQLADRFPPVSHADDAIAWVREAIRDIYRRMDKTPPTWVDHDQSNGWQAGGSRCSGSLTAVRKGADFSRPDVVKIVLVAEEGEEKISEFLPSTAADEELYERVEDVVGNLNASFAGVRAYRGSQLVYDEKLEIRD